MKTADVQRVCGDVPQESNRTVGALLSRPRRPIARRCRSARRRRAGQDYKGDAAKAQARPSTHAGQHRGAHQRAKLPGGLELALLPKKTRGGAVFAALRLRFGNVTQSQELGEVPFWPAHADARHNQITRQQI